MASRNTKKTTSRRSSKAASKKTTARKAAPKKTTRKKSTGRPPRKRTPKRRTQGFYVIRWIEINCVFTEGRWRGQPFRFQLWQKRLILELFETDDENRRRFIWALIGLPKGNGKTELAAALACYFAFGDDEPSPLVICAAASEKQADKVFDKAKDMCRLSPTLSMLTEPFDSEIYCESNNGRIRRVAANAGLSEGDRIYVVICDELHEWIQEKHEKTFDVLTNSTGGRGPDSRPMVFMISTAGHDKETILGTYYDHGKRLEGNEVDDPEFYFFWVEAPADCDFRDLEAYKAANPSYGVTVGEGDFKRQMRKSEYTIRRYFLNQWTETEEAWIAPSEWDPLAHPRIQLDEKLPIHVMIDVGINHDSSAVVASQRQPEKDRVVVRAWIWENPYPPRDPRHDNWRMNMADVRTQCRELHEEFPVAAVEVDDVVMPGPAFYYDKTYFEDSATMLRDEGITMIEAPQTDGVMVPASQYLFQLVKDQRLVHDGHKGLRRHILNSIGKQKDRGFRIARPTARHSKGRKPIDAAIACAVSSWKTQTPVPAATKKSKSKALRLSL